MKKNIKKVVNAWCMYDWANSAYSLTIAVAVFPVYYRSSTSHFFPTEMVPFFGIFINNTVLYSYSLSFSFFIITLLSPILSGISDSGNKRKFFLKSFALMGSGSCMMLYFFDGHNVEFGILFSSLACIGYAGSLVFYNSYLPEIVSADKIDATSARGYSLGYLGSTLLLLCNLVMILYSGLFGFSDSGMGSRVSFISVGIWWIGFSFIAFYFLPDNGVGNTRWSFSLLRSGYSEIKKVYLSLQKQAGIRYFLIAFFFYNAGAQTTMYLASLFGSKEMGLSSDKLILIIIIIQIVAIVGAYFFALVSKKRGARYSLMFLIVCWILCCCSAYFVQDFLQFFLLAIGVGWVMGGIQSQSRASYSQLIPVGSLNNTSYFSFYDVVDKSSTIAGTFLYGLIDHLTGSMRMSAVALCFLFIVSIFYMRRVKWGEGSI
ncbi:MAG: MFS transporter [Chitinophagaceae bacterium]|nr:MFS transporter [Chitinophagaceae bacterium]